MLPRGRRRVPRARERAAAQHGVPRGRAEVEQASRPRHEVARAGRAREPTAKPKPGSAEERAARKTIARIDKQLERIAEREAELDAEIAAHAHDYERLAELSAEYAVVRAEREGLEQEWLEAAELLE